MRTYLTALILTVAPPPLPDHPVTGQPVKPTWAWTFEDVSATNALEAVRCTVPPRGRIVCRVTGLTPEGVRIVTAWRNR